MVAILGVRDRRSNFVQLLVSMFDDKKLSLKAKGLIGYCLTKPGNWHFSIPHLCKALKEGEKAINSTFNECIELGYAYRYQPKAENGEFLEVEIIISDSKEEVAKIKKEIESQPEPRRYVVKNLQYQKDEKDAPVKYPKRRYSRTEKEELKTPLPCFGETANAPLNNIVSKNNIIKQQQYKKPPANPAVAFSKPKKKETGASTCAVYESLKSVDIPEKEKIQITTKYTPQEIDHALEWIAKTDKPIRCLPAAIKWACKEKPAIPKPKEDIELVNKNYALKYDGIRNSYGQTINVLNKIVEIDYGTPYKQPFCLNYGEKGFMEQLDNALRKNGFNLCRAT